MAKTDKINEMADKELPTIISFSTLDALLDNINVPNNVAEKPPKNALIKMICLASSFMYSIDNSAILIRLYWVYQYFCCCYSSNIRLLDVCFTFINPSNY